MPSYSTPGVYVEEAPVFPPSVAPVATAIPAFIGFTEKVATDSGEDLAGKPTRITSLLEYQALFGQAPIHDVSIEVTKRVNADDVLLGVDVKWAGDPPALPDHYLFYALQHYFANGGGPCYIYSLGDYDEAVNKSDFTDAFTALEAVDEPTLLVFPDAVRVASYPIYGEVIGAALASCNKMQDRFAIADVRRALPGEIEDNGDVTDEFRARIDKKTVDFTKYGAAYFPYLRTTIPFRTADGNIELSKLEKRTVAADGSLGSPTDLLGGGGAIKLSAATEEQAGRGTMTYSAIKNFVNQASVTLPPSGAVAGIYARVDRTRGVWKAPANVGVASVIEPAINATNDLQDGLNIDPTTGMSVNVIRSFYGKGTLVWGARTLAGNDSEWRYVAVRRFANFAEESIGKAIHTFVFEPNSPNTWVKVRTMIENFLTNQWRDGALIGAKPEDAFKVEVGLGKTMSPQDVLDGYMIVDVHLRIVRPAEFIRLRFMQKMPEA